jgi:DNA-directed RNA polymerase specialized sigma24 family protein
MIPHEDEEFTAFARSRLARLRRAAYLLCGDWTRGDRLAQRAFTDTFARWDRLRRDDDADTYLNATLVHHFIGDPSRGRPAGYVLARLTPRQRAVVVLRFFCGMSVTETALALRCSESSVNSQTSTALRAMPHAATEWSSHGRV